MMKHSARSGYIIITTLMIIMLAVSMVTYLLTRSSSYVPFIDASRKQEKARMLAFSGIQIGMAQLAAPMEDKKKQQPDAQSAQKKAAMSPEKHLAGILLPVLNRWQTFQLKQGIDGIDGTIKIALSAESGKINVNQIYDFKKKQWRGQKKPAGDFKKILTSLFAALEKQMGGKDLFKNMEKYLKDRGHKLDDVTELLKVPGFVIFKDAAFYQPSKDGTSNANKKAERPLYLTDIFTLYTQKYTIDPWVFSDSIAGLLGLKRAESEDYEARKKKVEAVLKQFKKQATWKTDWKKFLTPLYGKELQSLPKGIESVLDTVFNPSIFSIVVHATIDSVTQRVYAIVERIEKKTKDKTRYDMQIRKVYWL